MFSFQVQNASSRLWSSYVNVLGASPVLRGDQRFRLYRHAGLQLETDDIGPGCYFHTAHVKLGPRTTVNHGVHFENIAPVTVGADCGLGMYTVILTSSHEIGDHEGRIGEWHVSPVTIHDGSWIGTRVTILPGITIGAGCIIAAGAVVNRDCEPDGLYAGVPARRVRDLPR